MRKVFYSAAPCSLDDVLLDSYFPGMQDEKLDPKIVKLVKALLFAGIETISSCEGHPKNLFLDSFHYLKNRIHYKYVQKYSGSFEDPFLTSDRPIVELSPKT